MKPLVMDLRPVKAASPLALLMAAVLLTACSPQGRYKILSTVLDGVPRPGAEEEAEMSQPSAAEVAEALPEGAAFLPERPANYYHAPYQEKMCSDCHDLDRGNSLIEEQPALCYQCHDDPAAEYELQHGPVAVGYCTSCHDPHQSDASALLKYKGQALCFSC